MKLNAMLFVLWCIFTLLFICTIIGMFMFTKDTITCEKSTWMNIGNKLIDSIIIKKE